MLCINGCFPKCHEDSGNIGNVNLKDGTLKSSMHIRSPSPQKTPGKLEKCPGDKDGIREEAEPQNIPRRGCIFGNESKRASISLLVDDSSKKDGSSEDKKFLKEQGIKESVQLNSPVASMGKDLNEKFQMKPQCQMVPAQKKIESQEESLNKESSMSLDAILREKNPKKDSWGKLRNSLKGIQLLRSPSVKEIKGPDHLEVHFSTFLSWNSPGNTGEMTKTTQNNNNNTKKMKNGTLEEIEKFQNQEEFFYVLKRGRKDDIERLKEIIRRDKDRFVIDMSSSRSIVNKPDPNGITPLGAAVMSGCFLNVQFLIKYKADPLIKMKRVLPNGKEFSESLVETAARWKSEEILRMLLNNYEWNEADLKAALKAADSKAMKALLSKFIEKKTCWQRITRCIFSCLK